MNPSFFNIMTAQLLEKYCLINKPKHADFNMALFEIISKKQNFNLSGNRTKTFYNKATSKYIHCKKSFYKAIDC